MRSILLAILFFTVIAGFSQNSKVGDIPILATPNVTSLGIFGQIPTNKYNGLPQIDIPLYTVQHGAYALPLSLSYHAGGNRPDQHPGWTGMGFGLNTGGYVTRVKKGEIDELWPEAPIVYPYLENYNVLNDPNWNTPTYFDKVLKSAGSDTAFRDWQPDEFMFSVNGLSGSFFLDHTGKWVVRTKGEINIVVDSVITKRDFVLPSVFPEHEGATIPRVFYKFVIRDPQGVKYTFGGVDESIEFGRTNHKPPVFPSSTLYRDHLAKRAKAIIGTTWMLTSIELPEQRTIEFEYERDGVQIATSASTFSDKFEYNNGGSWSSTEQGRINLQSYYLTNPVYLKKIYCLNKDRRTLEEIEFFRSPSTQLPFLINFIDQNFLGYADLSNGKYYDNAIGQTDIFPYDKWCKLDSIVISILDSENVMFHGHGLIAYTQRIYLNYIHNIYERLKLRRVYSKGRLGGRLNEGYEFSYNTTPLPAYNSLRTDHWGYYNNNYSFFQPYTSNATPAAPFIDKTQVPVLATSKEPDFTYSQAEILNKITYPTGGYTQFYYGPHRYSKYLHKWPFQVVDTTEHIAGGCRIDSIESYDPVADKKLIKRYHYKKNFILGQSGSSGLLSAVPLYLKEFAGNVGVSDFRYMTWSIDPYNAMTYTNGNHVTYSEVTEEIPESGYTVSRYTNFDGTGNIDEAVPYYGNLTNNYSVLQTMPGKSGELERGLLLEEAVYDNNKTLLQRTTKGYTTDPSRFQQIVRSISVDHVYNYVQLPASSQHLLMKASAYPISTYYPASVTTTNTTFSGTDSIVSSSLMAYDLYRNANEVKTSTSSGDTLRTLSRYPNDYSVPGTTTDQRAINILQLQSNKATAKPIETVMQRKEKGALSYLTLSAEMLDYSTPSLLPREIRKLEIANPVADFSLSNYAGSMINSDSRYAIKQVLRYDEYNNLVEVAKDNDISEVFLWGHFRKFPVAKVLGSSYDTVIKYVNFTPLNSGTKEERLQQLTSLRNAFVTKPQVQITTYSFNPLVGMTRETNPLGQSIYYEYDEFRRLLRVRDTDSNVVKVYDYQVQAVTHGNPIWVTTGETRCKPCSDPAYTTNILQNREKDTNPNSTTYNQLRWTDAGTNSNCVVNPDWRNTTTALRCKQVSGYNTGEREQEQKDFNPCSPTFNTFRWLKSDTNLTSCPLPPLHPVLRISNLSLVGTTTSGDLYIDIYADAAHTIPLSAYNLTVNYIHETRRGNGSLVSTNNASVVCNGQEIFVGRATINTYGRDGVTIILKNTYTLTPGSGYVIP